MCNENHEYKAKIIVQHIDLERSENVLLLESNCKNSEFVKFNIFSKHFPISSFQFNLYNLNVFKINIKNNKLARTENHYTLTCNHIVHFTQL